MLVSGFMEKLIQLWNSTGLFYLELGHVMMVVLSLLLLFLAIKKNFEPLLLVPIGFGGLLANIPGAGIAASAVSQALQFGTPDDQFRTCLRVYLFMMHLM
jgi:oxaloacetate decarboxylase beta subunit